MAAGASPDRRYQVFISSTYIDLQLERQEVIQALLELDCFPAGMELFPASNDERWELIRSVIDDSDYYVVIIGGRYGSTDLAGISYTEREYDYAIASKKPVIGFLHADPGEIPKKFTESEPSAQAKLDGFREKVERKMCRMWKSPEELGSAVSRSIVKLMKSEPAEGWVRASNALTSEYLEETAILRRRIEEYEAELERARTTAPPGTERLAQGDDTLPITYFFTHNPDGYSNNKSKRYRGEVAVSVDNILAAVGPAMFDEATEEEFEDRLLRATLSEAREQDSWPKSGSFANESLLPEDVDVVRTQLLALRLIEKGIKKHGVNDPNRYWTLTPYGETHLTTLLAIKKGEES